MVICSYHPNYPWDCETAGTGAGSPNNRAPPTTPQPPPQLTTQPSVDYDPLPPSDPCNPYSPNYPWDCNNDWSGAGWAETDQNGGLGLPNANNAPALPTLQPTDPSFPTDPCNPYHPNYPWQCNGAGWNGAGNYPDPMPVVESQRPTMNGTYELPPSGQDPYSGYGYWPYSMNQPPQYPYSYPQYGYGNYPQYPQYYGSPAEASPSMNGTNTYPGVSQGINGQTGSGNFASTGMYPNAQKFPASNSNPGLIGDSPTLNNTISE